MSSCLFECLKEAGLEKYYSSLQNRGFDTAFSLLYVRTAELQNVGITTDADRQRFLQLVQIIASFHQGGELSPRRTVPLSSNLAADAQSRVVDKRPRKQRLLAIPDRSERSDSSIDSDSSDKYISSPTKRRDKRGNVMKRSSDRNMPVPKLKKNAKPPARLNVNFRASEMTVAGAEVSHIDWQNPGFGEMPAHDHERNNNSIHTTGRRSSLSGIRATDAVNPATESGCEFHAGRRPPRKFTALKVQRAVQSKGYNYGLPDENKAGYGYDAAHQPWTSAESVHGTNLSPGRGVGTGQAGCADPPPATLLIRDGMQSSVHQRITVCVRKRPLIERERQAEEFDVVTSNHEDGGKVGGLVVHELKRTVDMSEFVQQNVFQFDKVFSETALNKEVYDGAIKPMVDWIMVKNHRATCFGYGQTGAGKTHTLLGDQSEPGALLYAAKDVLSRLSGLYESSRPSKSRLTLLISLYEIYCSRIFDLLNGHKRLQALEDSNKQIQIHGLRMVAVKNMQSLLQVLQEGLSARSVGVTGANQDSSRSHAIVQLAIQNASGSEFSRLCFIDLAGSERACDALRDSDKQNRLEGAEINQSLLALKECIRSIDLELAHTPFRQSKLTQVLRDSFIGNSKTCMIANISPSHSSLEHTMNTLRYASRVKKLHRKLPTASTTPRAGGRFTSRARRDSLRRPLTADARRCKNMSPTVADSAAKITRSVSIESSMKVMDHSSYTGNGRELSRTPPPSQDFTHETQCVYSGGACQEGKIPVPVKSSTPALLPDAVRVGAMCDTNKMRSAGDDGASFFDETKMDGSLPATGTSHTTETAVRTQSSDVRDGHKAEMTNSIPVNGSTNASGEEKSVSCSVQADEESSNESRVTIPPAESNVTYSDISEALERLGGESSAADASVIPNFVCTAGDQRNVANLNVLQAKDTAPVSEMVIANSLANSDFKPMPSPVMETQPSRSVLPGSRSGGGLPSPQKFSTYLKDKHGLERKQLKQQLRRERRMQKLVLSDTFDEEGSDQSTASSTKDISNPSSTCSAPGVVTSIVQQKEREHVHGPASVPDGPLPPRLPSPMFNGSLPRRSSRSFHGVSPRSSSPRPAGGQDTPDEDSLPSTPSMTTGVTSASELHARLIASASMSETIETTDPNRSGPTNSSSNKENSKKRCDLRRARSEVVIAHQEHISEILRISIEEEQLYHELRDKWENDSSFDLYTMSLQNLLTRKTLSIEALKVQLALYHRVRGASS